MWMKNDSGDFWEEDGAVNSSKSLSSRSIHQTLEDNDFGKKWRREVVAGTQKGSERRIGAQRESEETDFKTERGGGKLYFCPKSWLVAWERVLESTEVQWGQDGPERLWRGSTWIGSPAWPCCRLAGIIQQRPRPCLPPLWASFSRDTLWTGYCNTTAELRMWPDLKSQRKLFFPFFLFWWSFVFDFFWVWTLFLFFNFI